MRILSMDVGIKNLAYCLFEKAADTENFHVAKWDVVDLSEEGDTTHLCVFTEKGKPCGKPAKYKKESDCFCLKHSKKHPTLQVPTAEHKPTYIQKQPLAKLLEMAESFGVALEPKMKKAALVSLLQEHVAKQFLETLEGKKAEEVKLVQIGENIRRKLGKAFEGLDTIDHVIIENQISPIATRMKTIQGMLVQYFIMSPVQVTHIEFISASNKLKECDAKDKVKYSDRKKLGIAKCLEYLSNDHRFHPHLGYFNAHKKKDDLADSFLQGMWYLKNKGM